VTLVVEADTERVNQAITNGSLDQEEVDQWLAGLEMQVKVMPEGTLQFGGRDASGS